MLIGHLPASYLMASALKARACQNLSPARVLVCVLLGALASGLAHALLATMTASQPLFWLGILFLSSLWSSRERHGKVALQVVLFSLGALLHTLLAMLA